MQYEDNKYAGYYNVGPDDIDCYQTGAIVDVFVSKWGDNMKWINWKPHWNLDTAIEKVCEWSKCWINNEDVRACMDKEINEFLKEGI